MLAFDQLLKRQAAIDRHLQAPFPNERLRYLQFLHAQGAARTTVIGHSWLLLAIVRGVRPKPPQLVTEAQIKAAARRWIHRRHAHQPRLTHGKAGPRLYISLARQWLRFLGWLATKPAERPYAKELDAYVDYMRTERNFSPATIRTYHNAAADFLRWIHSQHIELTRISAVTIDLQLAFKARHGVGRVGVQSYGSSLRCFLRFTEQCHWSPQGVAAGIELGRAYKTESLPIGPPWEAVVRMIEQNRGTRPNQIRDRAILLLFALYGLRSSEVRRLRIEDIDWEHALIHVHRSKQSPRVQTYPLAGVVRDALADYLQHVRPRTEHREIFLQLYMPYRPLGSSAFWQVVSKRLRPMQLQLKHHGPHALRHACATYLLSRGFSMKVIGDFLGHRYLGSTSTYAKVDIAGLRRVADFDLEGVLCSSNMP